MKLQRILCVVLLSLVFTTCKKEEASEDIKADIKTFYSLQNSIAKEFQATLSDTITDEFAHSERLLAWIQQQPDVVEAVMHSVYVFDVKHTNGLSGNILFTPKQTDVRLITRGGGSGTDGRLRAFKTSEDEKVITNKNVLVIAQYARDFYAPYCPDCKHIQTVLDLFEFADIDFDVTLKVDEGLSAFMSMSDYGIIIINTHGTPTGLASGEDIFNTRNLIAFSDDVEVADLPDNAASRLRDGELKLTSFWEYEKATQEMTIKNACYELTFNFFQSLPVQFDNTVMIGNYCYSGIQNGIMGDMLAPKGLKSFYGYGYANGKSYEVTNDLTWRAEDTIITNLIALDTTGIAHLANNTTHLQDDLFWQERMRSASMRQKLAEKYFMFGPQTLNHYLDPGYHFEKCGDTITDTDGQKYPTVCIGNKVWMAKNLNRAGAGVCYDNDPANCNKYGRLYSIAELTNLDTSSANPSGVRGLCPEGWHVPSTAEWKELFEAVNRNAGKLCETSDWPLPNQNTNETGLTLVPGGFYNIVNDTTSGFDDIGKYGHYWSATRTSDGQFYRSALLLKSTGTNAMNYNDAAELQYEDVANYGTKYFSCRCVKD